MCALCEGKAESHLSRMAETMTALNDMYWKTGMPTPAIGDKVKFESRTPFPVGYDLREGESYEVVSLPGDEIKMVFPAGIKEKVLDRGCDPHTVPDYCLEILDGTGQAFLIPFPASLIGFLSISE